MRVFVQAVAGSTEKRCHDEATLAYQRTVSVPVPYPFPYGFVVDTRGDDGDCVDCYVITETPLQVDAIVECTPVGLLEQREGDEVDHKVLAVPTGEPAILDPGAVATLRAFITAVFAGFPRVRLDLGEVQDAAHATEFVERHRR